MGVRVSRGSIRCNGRVTGDTHRARLAQRALCSGLPQSAIERQYGSSGGAGATEEVTRVEDYSTTVAASIILLLAVFKISLVYSYCCVAGGV